MDKDKNLLTDEELKKVSAGERRPISRCEHKWGASSAHRFDKERNVILIREDCSFCYLTRWVECPPEKEAYYRKFYQ